MRMLVTSRPTHPAPAARLRQRRPQIGRVRPWALSGQVAQHDVIRAIDQQAELRISRVFRGFPKLLHSVTPLNEVSARVSRFHARRVDCRQRHATLAAHDLRYRFVEKFGNRRCPQESPSGFLEGGVVRHVGQLDGFAPSRRIRLHHRFLPYVCDLFISFYTIILSLIKVNKNNITSVR